MSTLADLLPEATIQTIDCWNVQGPSAEAAIADLRTRRIAVDDALAQARKQVNGAWHEQRNHVTAARDDLERKADELSANFN